MSADEKWSDKDIVEKLKFAADFTRPRRVAVSVTLLDEAREEIEQLRERNTLLLERLLDMYRGDDGQAWKECEKFLERHYPKEYEQLKIDDLFDRSEWPSR